MVPVWITLPLVLIVGAALAWALGVYLTARALVMPPRMSDAKALRVLGRLTPADLHWAYTQERFSVMRSGIGPGRGGSTARLVMSGWWVVSPGASRTVVVIHGYADAKVGALAWALPWREMGFNILLLDLRAHGDSQGDRCSAGYHERHDVAAVIDQWRAAHPQATQRLWLFGASMGAAVATAVAAGRDDLAGLVIDSPYADFATAAAAHLRLLRLPDRWIAGSVITVAQKMTRARFADVAPVARLGEVRCPVLLIQSKDDPFAPPADQQRLAEIVDGLRRGDGASTHLTLDCPHLLAIQRLPDAYRAALADFVASTPMSPDAPSPRSMAEPG